MATKLEAIAEAFDNHRRWMNGAVVVEYENNDFEAIPGMYLSDVSYTGSKKVVHSLRREISDQEWAAFLHYQRRNGLDVPSRLSEAVGTDYANFVLSR